MHTKRQIETKKTAIRRKAEDFAVEYLRKGHGWDDETLYYNIEDLYSLVKEMKNEKEFFIEHVYLPEFLNISTEELNK